MLHAPSTRTRAFAFAASVALAAGCKRPPPVSTGTDADAGATATRTTEPSAASTVDADTEAATSAMAAGAPSDAGASGDDFALVAIGESSKSPIVNLYANGTRVTLLGQGFAAVADADGPLTRAPDLAHELLRGADSRSYAFAGAYPDLFALRSVDGAPCGGLPAPTVLVRAGAKWKEAVGSVSGDCTPFAIVPWHDGVLVVESQISNLGWATGASANDYDAKRPGAWFTQVARNGAVSHVSFDLDPSFLVWDASSDGTTLSLLGTFGLHSDGGDDVGSRDIAVMRGRARGAFRTTRIVQGRGMQMGSFRTSVRELGTTAIVLPTPARDDGALVEGAPTSGGDEATWKGKASSLFLVGDGDAAVATRTFRSAAEQDCFAADAALVGDDVYAIVQCYKPTPSWLVRIAPDGRRERVALRRRTARALETVEAGVADCRPSKLALRAPGDLWVAATCGGENAVPAVFRRGHAQGPLDLP